MARRKALSTDEIKARSRATSARKKRARKPLSRMDPGTRKVRTGSAAGVKSGAAPGARKAAVGTATMKVSVKKPTPKKATPPSKPAAKKAGPSKADRIAARDKAVARTKNIAAKRKASSKKKSKPLFNIGKSKKSLRGAAAARRKRKD